jgi:endonuclease/exonuclease/phosphatase family metal-dependent hydrolase
MRLHLTRRAAACLSALALVVTPTLLTDLSAQAASSGVTGVRVVDVTSSSITVSVNSLGRGWRYRLYASIDKPDVFGWNLTAPHATASKPTVRIGGLAYRTKVYWYRVVAVKDGHRRLSEIYGVGLRPSVPTNVQVSSPNGGGTYVTWKGSGQTGFAVRRATDAEFSENVVTDDVRRQGNQLTAYGLEKGTTYYFKVRADNNGTPSGWSPAVSAVAHSDELRVRVMSYNILRLNNDGTKTKNGDIISPWSDRRPKQISLIKSVMPDVIGVQEASDWFNQNRRIRQVDNLDDNLSGYSLAYTEIPPGEPGWHRTGDYILYRTSTVSPVGNGFYWELGDERAAAYQLFEHVATGARFLFVTPHLTAAIGTKYDDMRQVQTERMINAATNYSQNHGDVPIVYGGDFNSMPGAKHITDGPAIAMRGHHSSDAFEVARNMSRAKYNSANRYLRRPPADGLSIDHLYGSPGVGFASWTQLLDLASGKFVGAIPSDHNPIVADAVLPY